MALLELRGFTREPLYRGKDLDVEAGEVVVLDGATGSGKSLFLRSIADLEETPGSASLDGVARTAQSPRSWRRSVLYLHQDPPRPAGTVRADLESRGDARGVASLAEELGLELEREIRLLSGGEAQLLALARAFLTGPRIYLLDEPTSALDRARAAGAEAALLARVHAGAGLLWVTHEPPLAARVGARIEVFP